MRKAQSERGHCLLPATELVTKTAKILGVGAHLVWPVLDDLDSSTLTRVVLNDQEAYAPTSIHEEERRIADAIKKMVKQRPPWHIKNSNDALATANTFTNKPLTPSQANAFHQALKCKISCLLGGPGVGKTTLLKALLHAVRSAGSTTKQAAPTGRAAMNIIDATGLDADTVHLILGISPTGRGFLHNKNNPLNCDLLVLDESSMADTSLLCGLIDALPPQAALILVGDINQLEPVGPGRPFADIIESTRVPVFLLKEILRQAADSHIITNSHRIVAGKMPEIETDPAKSDFLFYRIKDEHDIADHIVDLASRALPRLLDINPLRDIQILSPMNVRTLGTEHLQPLLQQAINPPSERCVGSRWATFCLGDKVLHTRNNYRIGVRNGEIGIVTSVDPASGTVCVDYSSRLVEYDEPSMAELRLGYAVSVHKSQGSEYPAVIMPMTVSHQYMLRRRLLLTAVSRARRMMVMVGHIDALAKAVANTREDHRYSQLRLLLEAA
jgi:exodeoxyribonuclease V alpha subunit